MNVLEKILEEILQYRKDNNLYAGKQVTEIERIIRSHMNDGKDLNVPTKNEWIPVGERLPELGKEVLVQWELYDRYEDATYVYIDKLWINKKTGEWIGEFGVPSGKVVAWMELPEPYKMEVRL